jgi:protein MpaA
MNNHRAHDYRFLIRRWRAVARKAGLSLRPLAQAGDYPLYFLRSKALQTSGGLYISAGIHGDEPAGTEALISWAEENAGRLNTLPLLLLPCLNPWGLINNRRHDESTVPSISTRTTMPRGSTFTRWRGLGRRGPQPSSTPPGRTSPSNPGFGSMAGKRAPD